MRTRRSFLQALSTAGAAVIGASGFAVAEQNAGGDDGGIYGCCTLREGWEFRLDPDGSAAPTEAMEHDSTWKEVQIPHTWQSLGGSPEYAGVGWYRLRFKAPQGWGSQHVRMEFEAVTHSAHVFLNSQPIGEHVGKGYSAFTVDLSEHVVLGQENTLLVRVDNRPNDRMLPRNKSYDWTDDGGIIRPVHLMVTPQVFLERLEVDASPDLEKKTAEVRVRAVVANVTGKPQRVETEAVVQREGAAGELWTLPSGSSTVQAHSRAIVQLGPAIVRNPALWHFDSPSLYVARVGLKSEAGLHSMVENFGVRRFEARGAAFYLNGEKVSLTGVERMAGSHPELGMAETLEWIESNHRDMKRLNCVFTRVHWAQDRRVLDFCDRNGILMQEEVPAWGPDTFRETPDAVQHALEQNGLEQLREMIARDRNHPCIVSWGLCNEVDGKNPRSRQFAQLMSAEARRLDPTRLQTYASHTLGTDPGADMAGELDFISTNEYYGSWTPGEPGDVEAHLERIRRAFPNKPIVVSEYGWCECQPKIMPGDENRVAIIDSHTEVFRKFPEVAGAIYFDYNDYRTLVGDKGSGAMRQRVHGVVDLYGRAKPSFEALRLQCSPIQRAIVRKAGDGQYEITISTRPELPAYVLRGYVLRWIGYGYDDLPMAGAWTPLPAMQPGSTQVFKATLDAAHLGRIEVDILRPTGFSALTVEYLEGATLR